MIMIKICAKRSNPFLAIRQRHFYSPAKKHAGMSYTIQYLQSEGAAQNFEISALVNCMVQDGIKLNASDLHIEPWEKSIAVRARVNGVLVEVAHLPLEFLDKISMRFKVMANLVTYQAGTPQDGAAVGGPELEGVQLRISIFPTTRGEKIVIRLFDPRDRRFDLNALNFDDAALKGLVRLLKRSSGLLLFTGPTGSGKTNTMYSSLCHIMQRDGTSVSISTVEDPVEFNLPMISQTQINPAQEFTYAIALRSIMRQDPQIIMVGEIRDPETAAIAVQAGLTGHLVLSTIHSGRSAGAFTRLINMEIEPFMLASSILGVLGLRLVRCNCPDCSEAYEPDASQLRAPPRRVAVGGAIPARHRLPALHQHRFFRTPARDRIAGRGRTVPRGGLEEKFNLGPRGNCDSTRHENALAKRPAPRHQRPDVPGRNRARAGGGHDVTAARVLILICFLIVIFPAGIKIMITNQD